MTFPPIEPVPQAIEDLLHRRTDLSTFLVHLTRDNADTARLNLLSILAKLSIEARSMFGPAADHLRGTRFEDSQRAVCFTETPLEYAWMMCQPIVGRNVKLAGYGLAFAKDWARVKGANPVWYMDITPGHTWLTHAVNELIGRDPSMAAAPFSQPDGTVPAIFQLTPFWEQMGTGQNYRKEFSWEREWRFVGDLTFSLDDVVAVFAPAHDHDAFRHDAWGTPSFPVPPLLDPAWSLEKMVLALRHQH